MIMQLLCATMIFFASVICSFAQVGNETLTITTYYPSPAGVYGTLRMYPRSSPADCTSTANLEGKMYYDNTTRTLNVCSNSTAGVWGYYVVPGGGGYWALSGVNNITTANNTWNVGLGTSAPQSYARLEVNTTGLKSIYTMDNNNGGLLIGYNGSTIQARTTAHANTQNLTLQYWGGNVGIGTTFTPGAKLEVVGDFIRTIPRVAGYSVDGTDNGQIASRVLSITKKQADTGIRVTYVDNLRVVATNACRWEIRFDGASCTNPGGLYYDVYASGSAENSHETRTLIGTCFGLTAAAHQVQVWVQPTPGYSGGDCYTGWNNQYWTIEAEEVR
jgi:hypothetical protein